MLVNRSFCTVDVVVLDLDVHLSLMMMFLCCAANSRSSDWMLVGRCCEDCWRLVGKCCDDCCSVLLGC